MLTHTKYEILIDPARQNFNSNSWVQKILEQEPEAKKLELFLIWFSALGILITKPVDSWIRQAGERCVNMGLNTLGTNLIKHAEHEAGHDKLFEQDANNLISYFNKKYNNNLKIQNFLDHPVTPGISRYIKLHEDTIKGPAPYAQIAIELEIERLSIIYGPRLVLKCKKILGKEILSCLSFINEHILLDEGHTKFNNNQLVNLIKHHPEYTNNLIYSGTQALESYQEFLTDCLDLAQNT